MTATKFKVAVKPLAPAPASASASAEAFVAGAAMVQSQTMGRPLKPVRLNLDLDPATHQRLKMRAIERGTNVATLVRDLIGVELSK